MLLALWSGFWNPNDWQQTFNPAWAQSSNVILKVK